MKKRPQLFDDPTAAETPQSPHWKRKGDRATPSPIGSGPPSESCKSCEHATRLKYHDKAYYKCGLMMKEWTHGGASDIKLKWPACRCWWPKLIDDRIRTLGDFAVKVLDGLGAKWTPEALLIIADTYEEFGQDMGWLRHVAARLAE